MNLIEGIQQKCNLIRETILPEYVKIGPSGAFGVIGLREDIAKVRELLPVAML